MKTKVTILLFLALTLLTLAASAAYAAGSGYQLLRWTADSGGGYSQAEGYILRGTIGQPDTGHMSAGDYRLSSGYWAGGAPGDVPPPPGFNIYLPSVTR